MHHANPTCNCLASRTSSCTMAHPLCNRLASRTRTRTRTRTRARNGMSIRWERNCNDTPPHWYRFAVSRIRSSRSRSRVKRAMPILINPRQRAWYPLILHLMLHTAHLPDYADFDHFEPFCAVPQRNATALLCRLDTPSRFDGSGLSVYAGNSNF